MKPPATKRPVAAAAARTTTSFWSLAAGRHGAMAPRARNAKKASPATSTLGSKLSARARATVDFPAPGGPVTTTREAMDGLSPSSLQARDRHAPDAATRAATPPHEATGHSCCKLITG